MKHIQITEAAKNLNMQMIHQILQDRREGKETPDFQKPLAIEPVVHLPICITYTDANHRTGYMVNLNPHDLNTPTSARFFCADGVGTYREVELNDQEFKDLVEYYKLDNMDIWYKCHMLTK